MMINKSIVAIAGTTWMSHQKATTETEVTFYVKSVKWNDDLKTIRAFKWGEGRAKAARFSPRKAAAIVAQISRPSWWGGSHPIATVEVV